MYCNLLQPVDLDHPSSWRAALPTALGLTAHRPEMDDYLLGSHAARVVRHAPCSVFIVRQ